VFRANNAKLLGELADGRPRDARFVCAVALADGRMSSSPAAR
jgi:inosine/xanthosine triphosphate pyrophosphatase family protein